MATPVAVACGRWPGAAFRVHKKRYKKWEFRIFDGVFFIGNLNLTPTRLSRAEGEGVQLSVLAPSAG